MEPEGLRPVIGGLIERNPVGKKAVLILIRGMQNLDRFPRKQGRRNSENQRQEQINPKGKFFFNNGCTPGADFRQQAKQKSNDQNKGE